MLTGSEFTRAWASLAAEWDAARTDETAKAHEILVTALEGGLRPVDAVPTADHPLEGEPPDAVLLECAVAVVTVAGAFDEAGYRAARRGTLDPERDAVDHFCRVGWRTLDNPEVGFDVWSYWRTYLDPGSEAVNPYLHYLLVGRHAGAAALPERAVPRVPVPRDDGRPARRVCLFAAYDVDALVDDYVVAYLRELSRHCDVYLLADAVVSDEEMARLRDVTVGAWARPHGMYDMGSYALLARELVGWDALAAYDDVLLVNDSSYLLRPLDEVLARRDASDAQVWGLLATERGYAEEYGAAGPVPLDDVVAQWAAPAWRMLDRLHLGAEFLALRKQVVDDPEFRRWMDDVCRQPRKSSVTLKYEIGLTYHLALLGYAIDAFVDVLAPYHPLYTPDYLGLVRDGFPLLKRKLMAENPLDMPDVADWKRLVGELVPDAPVDMFERNLLRVAADDRIRRSFAVRTMPDGTVHRPQPLTRLEMRQADGRTPTYDHWWAFPVCAYDHTFASNERAVFEQVRDDPSIKKIVLTRSRRVVAEGENVVVVPLHSPEGQWHVLRAGHIFVKHAPRINVPYPLSLKRHTFVNLWHGIPLKRFGTASVALGEQRASIVRHNLGSTAVITSSRIDALAMKAAFSPLDLNQMWITGLPRNDFIVRDEHRLPDDMRAAMDRLRREAAGRRLVMFLPTFKNDQEKAYYAFSDDEIAWLRDWCEQEGVVIGVREHLADRAHTYSRMLSPLEPLNLSSRRYPDLEVLYRVADGLVTDYSSCVVDFLLTGKPVISFAYDYERYAGSERGFFYDLEQVLPGPVCRDFRALSSALETMFDPRTLAEDEDYAWRRRLFFDHLDDGSSRRVTDRVKALYVDGVVPQP
ncbi:CDP-glycerol glycerophosphotransferase family protein [Mumia sp. zg.B53]|uniref:CDP-glycerol glycerophosphotransferase family protein n=1 Tax=Mumia sp. zg.B53 TaxID=2855449 RepID=UPI001C6EB61A|nr:CDP-glycerol glycerophosphotransferase family protein [Mumia sp. zg.B53]MBW9214096.1 CDP-glycerol glycerophosphotransferase family protein [Mumia sp. zg.B53]